MPTLLLCSLLVASLSFQATHTTSLFCQMIAQLSRLSHDAEPTAFHRLLRTLDDHGKLLRVYTQNIDAIEQKTGLSFGLPEFKYRRGKNRSKGKATDNSLSKSMITPSDPTNSGSTRLPSPPAETPRCIPLHGTVGTVKSVHTRSHYMTTSLLLPSAGLHPVPNVHHRREHDD